LTTVEVVREQSWKALEQLAKEGKCKSIGVSNYNVEHLKHMEKYATVMPSVNQFEYHPYYQEPELVQYCNSHHIQVVAYSSLGQGKVDEELEDDSRVEVPSDCFPQLLNDETIVDIALKTQRTPSQVLLRWAVQQNIGKGSLPFTIDSSRGS